MNVRFLDPRSVAGKELHVAESCQVLVIGGGPAGLAAAIEAASRGLTVVLVDENPVPYATMGEDVPLHFGGGMDAVARNRNAMMEAFVASEPMIEEAFAAGVDVRLGTAAWGIYANGESVGWLPGPVTGISDGERSWLIGSDRIIVATGRRDVGLAFQGWDKPGVIGATAAVALATRYGALAATRAVVLGSDAEALAAALTLSRSGVRIVAVIERASAPVGPADLVEALRASGTEILTEHVVREALGRDRVEAARVSPIAQGGTAAERRIECDAVVLAVGTTPVIDLLDSIGCRTAFQPERGGWAPVLRGADHSTSLPGIYVAGDAAGIWAGKTLDRGLAEREGRVAGASAASALSGVAHEAPDASLPPTGNADMAAYRMAWVQASVVDAEGEPYVCLCEEVTAREILEVRPPRYLGAKPDRRNEHSLRSLLGDGPHNPDQVKRLTRAGMGPCQGRRCREQVACLLALGAGSELAEVPLAGYRAPVRPISLALAADRQESPAMTAGWDIWFGIAPQARLVRDLPPLYTVAAGNPDGPVVSE